VPITFQVDLSPSRALYAEIASLAPENPFYTFEYVQSNLAGGSSPWMLLILQDGRVVSGCPALLKKGFLNCSLEIESLPAIPEPAVFWRGLEELCRESRISQLGVHSAASRSAEIPPLSGEIWRKKRCEFVIDLRGQDLRRGLRKGHRWMVNRSHKTGVSFSRTTSLDAWQEHAQAVHNSMERRKARGESFVEVRKAQSFDALLQTGRGEIFQAVLDGRVLSSAFVIKAERGAYYHWAGTTADGMNLGASHYLVHEISKRLQEEGMDSFNLGGTGLENAGLVEFKRGFGTIEVSLESAEFFLGSRIKRRLSRALQLLREDPARLLKRGMDRLTQGASVRQC
jgi:hypothetical protein